MKFIYDKNGIVRMMTESEIDYDHSQLQCFEHTPTPEEQSMIDQNYQIKVKNNKLVFKMNDNQEKKDNTDKIKKKINDAQTIDDIKDILKKLL